MRQRSSVTRDLGIIALSIVLAVLLVKTGALKSILTSTQEMKFVGSFIAGLFFVSIFTVAPATVVLAEIAQTNSIFLVALFGGLGALFGDLVIFKFVKDRLSEDMQLLMRQSRSEKLQAIFRLKFVRWLLPVLGAIIVASPLPDELGLAMMGLSKMKTSYFIPLSFILNAAGILIIGLIAKAI